MRWSRNHNPTSVELISQSISNATREVLFEQSLADNEILLQTVYRDDISCTVLMGSPGPSEMNYVTINCHTRMQVSGIMCMTATTTVAQETTDVIYRLTHLKLGRSYSNLTTSNTSGYFNIDYVKEVLLNKADFSVFIGGFSETGSIVYNIHNRLDDLDHDLKEVYTKDWGKNKFWAWKETYYDCYLQHKQHNYTIICDLLGFRSKLHSNIHNLTKNVKVSTNIIQANDTTVVNDTLQSVLHCADFTVPLYGQCIHMVINDGQWQDERDPAQFYPDLQKVCGSITNDSIVFVAPFKNKAFLEIMGKWEFLQNNACFTFVDNYRYVWHYKEKTLSRSPCERNAIEFILCTSAPIRTVCPSGYVSCGNGCISDTHICDGKVDCQDGEDEGNCSHVCTADMYTSLQFCLKQCHPDNCTCHELYFQCQAGGCLHSALLCDGNSDCVAGGDEIMCPENYITSFQKSTRDILTQITNFVHDTIISTDNCHNMDCIGSFKCRNSYCIPAHKVCDGELDCPFGDDEGDCLLQGCTNMLYCGTICVHPIEICDGTIHCLGGEDELMCGAPDCPSWCQCHGYSVKCTQLVFDVTFSHIKMLSLYVSELTLHPLLFHNLKSLLILDLSYCDISSVNTTTHSLSSLNLLFKLDLSHNVIDSLEETQFEGLTNLQYLDMSWNPLHNLESKIFDNLVNLDTLILKHCEIKAIPFILIDGTMQMSLLDVSNLGLVKLGRCSVIGPTIQLVNLTGTIVAYSGTGGLGCLNDAITVLSDQTGFCCLDSIEGNCIAEDGSRRCRSFWGYNSWLGQSYVSLTLVLFGNFFVIMYTSRTHDVDNAFLGNLAAGNLLLVIPLYLFSIWESKYGTEFSFYETFLSKGIWCSLSGGVLFLLTQITTSFLFLVAFDKYSAIVVKAKPFFIRGTITRYLVNASIWLTWISTILFSKLFANNPRISHTRISHCLFGTFNTGFQMFVGVCGLANIIVAVTITILYCLMLKTVCLSHKRMKIGRKHGTNTFIPTLIRLLATTAISVISISFSALIMIVLSFQIGSTARTTHLFNLLVISLIFSNPVTLILVKRRFLIALKQSFTFKKRAK